jgi:hypothetical protein
MIIKNIKDYRNSAPYGKRFIKRFYDKLTSIDRALHIADAPSFVTAVNSKTFKVTVRKDETPKGLEFETIPVYKSYCVYIDGEAVCRAHVLHINSKNKIYIEFSSKRKYSEVIEIVDSVYVMAKEILTEDTKKWLSTDKRSFYETKINN